MQEGGKEESSEKPRKKREAPTKQGSKGRILAISQHEQHGQHWRKTHCTLHPFPIPSAQSQAGRGPMVGLGLPPAPRPGAACSQSLSRVLPLLPYALAIPIFPLCSNCPNLGILGSLEVQKRELPIQVSLFYKVPQLLPQGVVWILGRSTI